MISPGLIIAGCPYSQPPLHGIKHIYIIVDIPSDSNVFLRPLFTFQGKNVYNKYKKKDTIHSQMIMNANLKLTSRLANIIIRLWRLRKTYEISF